MLSTRTKIQYFHTLIHGAALLQLDMVSVEVGSTTSEHLKLNILGLCINFFPVNALPKKSVQYTAEQGSRAV